MDLLGSESRCRVWGENRTAYSYEGIQTIYSSGPKPGLQALIPSNIPDMLLVLLQFRYIPAAPLARKHRPLSQCTDGISYMKYIGPAHALSLVHVDPRS